VVSISFGLHSNLFWSPLKKDYQGLEKESQKKLSTGYSIGFQDVD
jgi:hypothetical protein